MTKEEIVDGLEIYTIGRPLKNQVVITVQELQNFIDAIKVLEQEHCEDAISREEFIERYKKWAHIEFGNDVSDGALAIRVAKSLPPVAPKQKMGHWFIDERPESDRGVICSNCEQPIFKYHKLDCDYRPKYCPNCGAKMIESEDKE